MFVIVTVEILFSFLSVGMTVLKDELRFTVITLWFSARGKVVF